MAFDVVSALGGAAAGWAAQWFLIDKPIYRKLDGNSASAATNLTTSATVDSGLQAKLDACAKEKSALNDEIAHLKAELADTNAAFNSAKAELGTFRAQSGDVRDDLELIDGIGPVFERKLYDAKVYTFDQLSKMNADEITKIIAPQKWQKIEPAKWIAEAADRAKKG